MLSRGTTLTKQLIAGLLKNRIENVYIDNSRHQDTELADLMSMELLRNTATEVVRNVFSEISENGGFTSRPVIRLADDIVRHLIGNPKATVQTKEYRLDSGYLFSHSVNVCMLAIMTGRVMGYTEQNLRTLAIGGLLHDIGYASPLAVDPKRDHPRIGFDLIRRHPELPLLAGHAVFQHHEQLNGGGFPLGIQGDDFRQAAQIVAIANDFDHFVNEIGTSRLPHEGIEYVMSKVDTHYEIAVVRAFVQGITPYPIGTVVRLSNGMVGTVTELHKGHPSRPVIITSDFGLRIDLMHFQTDFIEEVILDKRQAAAV